MVRCFAAWLTLMLVACDRPPDVILVSIDTLRVDHVSAYNPRSRARTPSVDQLAEDGIRFTRAYSPISVTGPAFCTVHTGLEPSSHGVVMNLFRGGPTLAMSHTTLAEHLAARGHRAGAFVSGFTLRPELDLDQGFEVYDAPAGRNRSGSLTRRKAEEWWDGVAPDEKLFLWFHSFDPHGPLSRWSRSGRARAWRKDAAELMHYPRYQQIGGISDPDYYSKRYARAVRATDRDVGALLDRLKSEGRYRDALIIFHADHGESLTERNMWFDHGFGAYEEQLHVPLIVKLPKNRRAGEVNDALVSLADILPTVLDESELWSPAKLDGRSLLAPPLVGRVLVGESSHCKKNVLFGCSPEGVRGKHLAARDGEQTVLEWPIGGGELARAVYSVRTDPEERTPRMIAPSERLLSALAPVRADRDGLRIVVPTAAGTSEDEEQSSELESLKALGYIE